jgi:hypothetical protein
MMQSIVTYAQSHLLLIVTFKPFMLSDIMLNVMMLSVVARLELIRVEHLTGLHSNGKHLALTSNIRLGSGNTLAY